MVFEIVCGYDETEINAEKKKFIKKHYSDDMNFTEIALNDLSEESVKSAMSCSPMLAETYIVVLETDRNSFAKYAPLLTPKETTALLVIIRDHMLAPEAVSKAVTLKTFPKPTRKDYVAYAGTCGKEYGIDLNMDERKLIADLFPDKNNIRKIVFQLSLLPAFDRKSFLLSQADSKRMYKWEMVAALSKRDLKSFVKEYYTASGVSGTISEEEHMRVLYMLAGMIDSVAAGNAFIPEFIKIRADEILSNPNLQSYLSFAIWDIIAEIRAGAYYGDPMKGLTVFIIRKINDIINNMNYIN